MEVRKIICCGLRVVKRGSGQQVDQVRRTFTPSEGGDTTKRHIDGSQDSQHSHHRQMRPTELTHNLLKRIRNQQKSKLLEIFHSHRTTKKKRARKSIINHGKHFLSPLLIRVIMKFLFDYHTRPSQDVRSRTTQNQQIVIIAHASRG